MREAKDRLFANRHTNFVLWMLLGLSIILISVFAHYYSLFPGDLEIARWLRGIDFPLFQTSMKVIDVIAFRFIALMAVILCALLLWAIRRRTEVFFVAVGLIPYGLGAFIKTAVDRPRPWELEPGLTPWFVLPGSSFPSGHIMHFVLFYGMLLYLAPTLIKKRRARLALQVFLASMILLAAPAEVCAARHWLSDVLGGYMVGGFFLIALIWGYERCKDGRFDRWYEALRLNTWWPQMERLNGRWPLRRR